jgi:hypothetical protein
MVLQSMETGLARSRETALERKPAIKESIFSTLPAKGAPRKTRLISSENVKARAGISPESRKKQAAVSAITLAKSRS